MKSGKCSVFKQIKNFLTRQREFDARLFDFMQEHLEITPDDEPIEAPPGDFQKIMEEMNKRGIEPAVRKQLKWKILFDRIFRRKKY